MVCRLETGGTSLMATNCMFTRLFKGNRCSVVCFTCKRYAQAPPEVRMQLGGAGFHFRWCNPSLQYAVTSHKVDRHSAPESRDNQDHKALQAASQAAWGLLHVNSNQPGGGGVALYHHHFAKLQKQVNKVEPINMQINVLREAITANVEMTTPGTYRIFIPKAGVAVLGRVALPGEGYGPEPGESHPALPPTSGASTQRKLCSSRWSSYPSSSCSQPSGSAGSTRQSSCTG